MALTGSLTWSLQAGGDGSEPTVTYVVVGYQPGGLQGLAPMVDAVLAEQLGRLER